MVNYKIHTTDWNVLVILDACRYDYFEEMNHLRGTLEKVETTESCTYDWLIANFSETYPYVYISANPFCAQRANTQGFIGGKHFEKVIDVWNFGWNSSYNTVLPPVVTTVSIPYLKEEKVIIHYMQPHQPGIGNTRDRLLGWRNTPPHVAVEASRYRRVSMKSIVTAYTQNLRIVLNEMRSLIACIPEHQKIVITSDHGEVFQRGRVQLHPCGMLLPELCDVPWFEVER